MVECETLYISKVFSPFPGGRHEKDGPFSGQRFRDEFLEPSLAKFPVVHVILDGVAGLPSSFLEEVMGGLVRRRKLPASEFGKRLKITTSDPELEIYIPMAMKYARDAAASLS